MYIDRGALAIVGILAVAVVLIGKVSNGKHQTGHASRAAYQ